MALIVDNTTSNTTSNVNTSYSWSHECSTDATLLVVTAHASDSSSTDADVTGITYNSVALTKADEYFGTTDDLGVDIWYLFSPSSGSNTVEVTHGGKCSYVGGVATSFEGIYVAGGKDSNANNTGSTTTPTVTVNCSADVLLVGGFTMEEADTTNESCDDTGLALIDIGGQTGGMGYTTTSASGNDTVSWTNDVSDNWVTAGVSFFIDQPPTIALGTNIVDTAEISDTTPTFEFTGTDSDGGNDVTYNVQVDTVNTFDGEGATPLYYFDASDNSTPGTPLDPNSVWTNDEDAFDDASNSSYTISIGSTSSNYLQGDGTNAPTSGGAITEVKARVYCAASGSSTLNAIFYTSSRGEELGNVTKTGITWGWSDDVTLSTPTGGWTWQKIKNLVVVFFQTGSSGYTSHVGKAYVEVSTTAPLIDAESDADTGFARDGDSDPFTSGEEVTYTVQGGDELSADTYYWRVRGKDPTGSNEYGDWSSIRSFTVTSGTAASSTRDIYSSGKDTSSSERGLYSVGKLSNSSERGIYSIGGVDVDSERDLYTKGVSSSSSERGLYSIGGIDASSERSLYTEGGEGAIQASSERDIYSIGSIDSSSERSVYTVCGGIVSSERDTYTKGVATTSSERGLYTTGSLSSSSERSIYTEGEAAVENWLTNWDYRVKITVQASEVDADLENFPVYVDLNDLPAGFHTNVNQTDARDIRVTTSDGETEVPREVVFYTAVSDTGELHFKGTVSSSTNTDFYIYYGNSSATEPAVDATYGRDNTWSKYLAVYHLQESANTDSGGYVDSTGNGHDGTGVSMSEAASTGKLSGNGANFDGTDDRIGSISKVLTNNTWSGTGWMKLDALGGSNGRAIFYQGSGSTDLGAEFGSINEYPSAGDQTLFARSGGATLATSDDKNYSIGNWYYWGGTFDNTTATFYFQGGSGGSGTVSGSTQPDTTCSLAAWYDYSSSARYLNGAMDEVRISDDVLTSTWISTEYNNQSDPDTFFSIGSQEEPSGGTEASSERDIYTKSDATSSSQRDIYSIGSINSDSERDIYTEGSVDASSERNIYTSGVATSSSERDIYSEGSVTTSSEHSLYTEGSIDNSSERDIYTKSDNTDSSTRDIYSTGSITDSSERGIYSMGPQPTTSERGIYSIGSIDQSSEKDLYTKGIDTSSSERDIYTTGQIAEGQGESDRDIYTKGIDTSSSERDIYSVGGGVVSSERDIYTIGNDTDSSERDIHTEGKETDSSQRDIYTSADNTASSQRTIYAEGDLPNSSERAIYTKGIDTDSSERSLYSIGGVASSSERGIHTLAEALGASQRGVYIKGASAGGGNIYWYNGTSWELRTVYRYNGVSWEEATVKRYNGISWENI